MALLKNVEGQVFRLEGFKIRINHERARRDARGDRSGIAGYPYRRRMPDDKTVNEWKVTRFAKRYPGFVVDVLDVNNKPVRGQTKLATVRASYP